MPARQIDLFRSDSTAAGTGSAPRRRSGAFVDNMSLPVHRWYRYSAGFSAAWVRQLVRDRHRTGDPCTVLDPFAGVATTLIACAAEGVPSWGFETHPFVHRVATAKIRSLDVSISRAQDTFRRFLKCMPPTSHFSPEEVPPLLAKCYHSAHLSELLAMRDHFSQNFDAKTPETELLWLTITSILRPCSKVGTAPWQYVLPKKPKLRISEPHDAFREKALQILEDIEYAQRCHWHVQSRVFRTDARSPSTPTELNVNTVITSPPYPNNYDYADATRLEMTFWGEINAWSDLQRAVRRYLIRSCSQHASAEKLVLDDLLAEPVLDPIRADLARQCRSLADVRMERGGRKSYHTMAAAYFRDLGLVFNALRDLCKRDSLLCFVIGDSAPYGVYLAVDQWLGRLALAAGFESVTFEELRKRNTRWKNRKHRVPLKEGRLWIQG